MLCLLAESGIAAMGASPFIYLCNRRQTAAVIFSVVVLACTWAYFWAWWVVYVHLGVFNSSWTFSDSLLSAIWALQTFDTIFAYSLLARAKTPDARSPAPCFRVAMIVTRAPSEPFEVVKGTLIAMMNQDYLYSYDVWLADERPTSEITAWCAENGVRVSCRFGVKEYHRATWPRRTKCKEGNLSYFYDHWGYDQYDIVAQFDCDHIPATTYLTSCLPAFMDSSIGYVAAPSVNSLGSTNSWAARGRLHYEGIFHGAGQAAWFPGWMPVCIGSHYTVRTAHLKSVGGIGPELDEDFSTSYLMTTHGYKGAFSLRTAAVGQGPATFEDSMKQEYQWARSFIIIVLKYIKPFWSNLMSRREKARIQMCIFYYFWHAAYPVLVAALVLLPCLGFPYGPCTWADVLLHASLPVIVSMIHCRWLGNQGWLRPQHAPVISWESALHQFVRTYWIMKGVVHAVIGHFTGIQFAIAVTPKGDDDVRYISQSTIWPFAIMSLLCCAATWRGDKHVHVPFVFSVWNLVAIIVIIGCHYQEQHKAKTPWSNLLWVGAPGLLVTCCQLVTLYHRGMLITSLFWQTMAMLQRTETAWDDNTTLQAAWLLVCLFGAVQLGVFNRAGKSKVLHASKNKHMGQPYGSLISKVERIVRPDMFFVLFQPATLPGKVMKGEHLV